MLSNPTASSALATVPSPSYWLVAGSPTDYRGASARASNQGYYFGHEHDMPEPKVIIEAKAEPEPKIVVSGCVTSCAPRTSWPRTWRAIFSRWTALQSAPRPTARC